MYRLKHANSVPIPGQPLRIGLPIYAHTTPNIAIVSVNNMDVIHLNADVLRDALLSSPKEVEQLLGLKVIDAKAQPVPEETPTVEPPKKVSKETKASKESKESKEVEEWV